MIKQILKVLIFISFLPGLLILTYVDPYLMEIIWERLTENKKYWINRIMFKYDIPSNLKRRAK